MTRLEKQKAAFWRRNPELRSVYNHYQVIFNRKNPSHKTYKGMLFSDEWNPKKGGSFQVAKRWILENIGKRPRGCSLHIIEHEKGFVPGNLAWASRRIQNSQQARYEISRLKHRISVLEKRLRKCE